jgi:hypothetical protein
VFVNSKNIVSFIGIGLLWGAGVCAGAGIRISGRVLDNDAAPVQDASVKLLSQPSSVVTDKYGLFLIALTSVKMPPAPAQGTEIPMIKSGMLIVRTYDNNYGITVYIRTITGRTAAVICDKNTGIGLHSFRLSDSFVNLAPGLYVVSVKVGMQITNFKLISTKNSLNGVSCQTMFQSAGSGLEKILDAAVDTVIISKSGFLTKRIPISSLDSTLADRVIESETVPYAKKTVVATTTAADYSAGNVGTLKLEDNSVAQNLLAVHSDTYVRTYHCATYIIERLGKDNIIKITGRDIAPAKVDYQVNIGHSVNLQDIAFANDNKAYITQMQSKDLVIFNPATGAKTGTIDLSRFNTFVGTANAEPYPYMSSAVVYGGFLYVACQRLAHSGVYLNPGDTSLVVVISAFSDSITGAIALSKKNPYSVSICDGKMYVSSAGAWGNSTDGGVECVDLFTNTNLGVVAMEGDFGGDVSTIQMTGPDKGYVAVGKNSPDFSTFWTEIMSFNPQTRCVGQKVQNIDNAFGGLSFDGQLLYIGDRSLTKPGIVVIDPVDDSKKAGPFDMGLPPNALAVLKSN